MKVHYDILQHSPEWFEMKVGKPSTSNFYRMMANKRGTDFMGDTAKSYALDLAIERITGEITYLPQTRAMKRGTALEPEAREYYADNTFQTVIEIGGIDNHNCYCSTDGLVMDDLNDRIVEIKCQGGTKHYNFLLKPKSFIKEHKWQLYGELWVSERKFVDAVSYHPGFDDKQLIIEVQRDEKIISQIAKRAKIFNELVDKYELKIKNI